MVELADYNIACCIIHCLVTRLHIGGKNKHDASQHTSVLSVLLWMVSWNCASPLKQSMKKEKVAEESEEEGKEKGQDQSQPGVIFRSRLDVTQFTEKCNNRPSGTLNIKLVFFHNCGFPFHPLVWKQSFLYIDTSLYKLSCNFSH